MAFSEGSGGALTGAGRQGYCVLPVLTSKV